MLVGCSFVGVLLCFSRWPGVPLISFALLMGLYAVCVSSFAAKGCLFYVGSYWVVACIMFWCVWPGEQGGCLVVLGEDLGFRVLGLAMGQFFDYLCLQPVCSISFCSFLLFFVFVL